MAKQSKLPRKVFDIRPDDLSREDTVALLQQHLDEMFKWSPADQVHAFPAERLKEEDVSFYAARHDGKLACVGALKHLDEGRGELKSMRASDDFRGTGAGEAMLLHLMAEARLLGYKWLGLETGGHGPFKPAINLYTKHGFAECHSFGDYLRGDFSICMSRKLD